MDKPEAYAMRRWEPVPLFTARTSANPAFKLEAIAGRYIVLCFVGAAPAPGNDRILAEVLAAPGLFDGDRAVFVGISIDPADLKERRLPEGLAKTCFIWDFDRAVSDLFGAIGPPGPDGSTVAYRRRSVVIDPQLRLVEIVPLEPFEDHVQRLAAVIARAAAQDNAEAIRDHAPVLMVPRIFEPEFCRELIAYYDRRGGVDSGFMVEADGLTVGRTDHRFKRRADVEVAETTLRTAINRRLGGRLKPELRKVFGFEANYIERYLIARYDGETQGHFAMHRDNTTKGTAHRRFAVSVGLNDAADYGGGDLRFPEYGRRKFRIPLGAALVFSCSLLHEVLPVTAGHRYVLVPFLYDEPARRLRDENRKFVASEGGTDAAETVTEPG